MTPREHELLALILRHLSETGVAPSYAEMTEGLGLRSKSGAYRLINSLEAQGYVQRIYGRVRGIELLRLPAGQKQYLAMISDADLLEEVGCRGGVFEIAKRAGWSFPVDAA